MGARSVRRARPFQTLDCLSRPGLSFGTICGPEKMQIEKGGASRCFTTAVTAAIEAQLQGLAACRLLDQNPL